MRILLVIASSCFYLRDGCYGRYFKHKSTVCDFYPPEDSLTLIVIAMAKDSIQSALRSWSDKLFPGISTMEDGFMTQHGTFVYDIKSSLLLQMGLYFNIVYFPVWFLIMVVSFINKYYCYGWFARFLLGIGVTAAIVLEVIRLYFGMRGNLKEQVAELSTFWFTTLLVQQPMTVIGLIIALSTGQVLEFCAMSVLGFFITFQLIVSFGTLRNVARHQELWRQLQT